MPLNCPSCNNRYKHVYVQSPTLVGMGEDEALEKFKRCLKLSPIHIYKFTTQQPYCHPHFKTEGDAALFFVKSNKNNAVREMFRNLIVKPARNGTQDVVYDVSLIQSSITDYFIQESFLTSFEKETRDDELKLKNDEERIRNKKQFLANFKDMFEY